VLSADITDEKIRLDIIKTLLTRWLIQDRKAATEWMSRTSLPQEILDQLQQFQKEQPM